MVYLHFEDWSSFMKNLDAKGIPHGNRIIKVKASFENPRDIFRKETLEAPKYSDRPFRNELFNFGERGIYTGVSIEQYMVEQGFTETGKRMARALFRFAVQPEAGFVQRAMAFKKDGTWFIDHPMQDLDGLSYASRAGREENIHLDIFYPDSLEALKRFVSFNDSSRILSLREYMDYQHRRGKERD